MKTHIKTPCKGCPFTKNGVCLTTERGKEIAETDVFVCHKAALQQNEKLQCAGFLHFNKHAVFNRVATALNIDLGLKNDPKNPVCTEEEFFKKHSL